MKNSSFSKAKKLTLIPLFVLAATAICLVLASLLEVPTGRGVLYTVFAAAGLISIFISPIPCLILSILGTVSAEKAVKEGSAEARKYFVLGAAEILVYVIGALLTGVMFMVGMGV